MPPHKSALSDYDICIPATPPTSPADSEMSFDIGRMLLLSPEARILLNYLKSDASIRASPTTVVVYYYLPGETYSSDSSTSPPSPLPPPRSSKEGAAGPSRSRDPTRDTGSQDRITPSTRGSQRPGRSSRRDEGATKGKPKNRHYRRACPPPDEGNSDDDTSLTARLRENLRSQLGTLPSTTNRALPASEQTPTRPIVAGASHTPSPGLRPTREHRRHHLLDERDFSFLDPEYDADLEATPSPPPPPLPPVQSRPLATARFGPITTPTKRCQTATNVANPNLAPSRPSLTPRSSPTPASPRIESKRTQPGLLQVSLSGSATTISPPVSTAHRSATPIRYTGPSSATLSVTTLTHPPASGVSSCMATHSESQQTRGGPSSAPVVRPLLARRSMQLTPLQAATSSQSPPELFSPNRQHSRRPVRRGESLTSRACPSSSFAAASVTSALATTMAPPSSDSARLVVLAPSASCTVAPAETSQTVSGETEAVNEPSSSTSCRVKLTVDCPSVRTRRRRGDQKPGEVQVLRSARIRDKQAKREADITVAQDSSKKKRKH